MHQDKPGGAGSGLSQAGTAFESETSAYQAEVPSPCIDVCRMDAASGLCAGCSRTLEEIACWSGYSAAQKRAVLARLPSRKPVPR